MTSDYAAGFIDGEGWIGVVPGKSRTPEGTVRIIVTTTQTSRPVLEALRSAYGGYVTYSHHGRERQKPCYIWRIEGKKAASLLLKIKDRLMVKRAQALVALSAWLCAPGSGRNRRWDPAVRNLLILCARKLNRRGIAG